MRERIVEAEDAKFSGLTGSLFLAPLTLIGRQLELLTSEVFGVQMVEYQTVKPLTQSVRKFLINLMERTNKMQPCSTIYYSNVF